jgi:hypothetical protein
MERPIVASLRGEAAGILERSGAAIVVEPEDSESVAEALHFLISNRPQAQEMGKRGRKFVMENFDRTRLAATYISVMEAAVANWTRK